MPLNKELLDILACPACRGELTLLDGEEGLRCPACAVVYPVRDEIPVMLVEEAVAAEDWERGERTPAKRR